MNIRSGEVLASLTGSPDYDFDLSFWHLDMMSNLVTRYFERIFVSYSKIMPKRNYTVETSTIYQFVFNSKKMGS